MVTSIENERLYNKRVKKKGGKIRSGNRNVEFEECQYLITTVLVENRHHTNVSVVKFETVWIWKTEFFKSLIIL